MAPAMAAFQAYADDLSAAGVLIGTEVLDSVVVDDHGDGPQRHTAEIQDGPFADTKEKLGGIFVIDVDQPRRGDEVGAAQSRQRLGLDRDPPGGADIRRRPRVVQPVAVQQRVADLVVTTPTVGCSRCSPRPPVTSPLPRMRLADCAGTSADAVAAGRSPRQPGGVAAHRGAQPAARPVEVRTRTGRPARWTRPTTAQPKSTTCRPYPTAGSS